MAHDLGACIGGIRSVEDVRLRCVCDPRGCWHLRSAIGRPMPRDRSHSVWVHGVGCVSAPRAVWQLHIGETIARDLVVSRTCTSYDCVNPKHLRCWTKAEEHEFLRLKGRFKVPSKQAAARAAGRAQSKLTDELRVWLVESPQTGVTAAHGLGISQGRASSIRAAAAKRSPGASSVFDWRPA